MTKKELAEKIAETHDLSKAESEKIISSVFIEISCCNDFCEHISKFDAFGYLKSTGL